MGKISIYNTYEDMINNVNVQRTFPNHILNRGKSMILDSIFSLGGDPWERGIWYMTLGDSTDTNAFLTGPTPSTPVSSTGDWQGPDEEDSKLTSPLVDGTIKSCTQVDMVRAGATVFMFAVFTATHLAVADDIYEFIISNVDLSTDDANQASLGMTGNTAIIRSVNYTKSADGTEYTTEALNRETGKNLYIKYDFADLEAS